MKFLKPRLYIPVICILILTGSASLISCSKSSNSIDVTSGLVAYYNFDGGSLNDGSGMGNNIVFNNAVKTPDRHGVADNAYLFDGSTSYMTVKNSTSLNPGKITIFAIVKVNGFYVGTCSGNQILSKGYPYDIQGFYSMQFFDYNNGCGVPNTSNETFGGSFGDDYPQGAAAGAVVVSDKVATGQWYYLAFTYDDSTANFYINGQLKVSVVKTVPFTPNAMDLFIGKHENPPYPYYFNGVIDEIRIYNRALPANAIAQLSK